jgi:membrane-bound lytic murein transglycosylase B
MLRSVALFLSILFVFANLPEAGAAQKFSNFLKGVRKEALRKGIAAKTLDAALKGIKPIPRVVELDRKQPEFSMTFAKYRQIVAPKSRVKRGRKKFAENRKILDEVSAKYGVQARFIVAFWGIETGYGRTLGGFKVIPALATLAHDGRRSKYFRTELMNALKILDQGHISPAKMIGSWAGAMGQSQFMPSSFINFAVDHDGDGRRDIWRTRADVFASAANYLAKSGWRGDETWGRAVRLPKKFNVNHAGLKVRKDLATWQKLGIRNRNGSNLPARKLRASLILPEKGRTKPAYLVYQNFRTILKWNRSNYFALGVGILSDAIGKGK